MPVRLRWKARVHPADEFIALAIVLDDGLDEMEPARGTGSVPVHRVVLVRRSVRGFFRVLPFHGFPALPTSFRCSNRLGAVLLSISASRLEISYSTQPEAAQVN